MAKTAGDISHWFAQMYGDQGALPARRSLTTNRSADVCIVGAGYTGLWTAYELKRSQPDLDIVVLEAKVAGYGASGRNGGAVIAQLNGSRSFWEKKAGRAGAIAMERAIQATVDEIGEAVERESIDCSFSKNGVMMVARTELELERFAASVEADRKYGFGDDDSRLLDAKQTTERIKIENALGARFSPHCASIHPGRLVRGLADVVERLGVTIYERSPVTKVVPGAAHTSLATVNARFIVRAAEAYTESIATERRAIVPVHTSMLVTEPIDDAIWAKIGWRGREALLAEHPFLHLQHTADGRITIGGDDNRIPYRFGSRPARDEAAPPKVFEMYRRELVKLFPPLKDVRIERSWQGIFGAPRDWAPSVRIDRSTGIIHAGGYVGEGVAASNLAGRTVRDLLLEKDTELTRLPWVGGTPSTWEPEPLRAIGATVIWALRARGDAAELESGRPSRMLDLGNKLAGYSGHLG